MTTGFVLPALLLIAIVNLVMYRAGAVKKQADANLRAHYDAHPEKAEARALMRAAGYNV
ncbi:hypothetical protein [Paraburkholderia sp. A3RO-2L]|uniref:hypothetical protein n=1 Tax=unclassified Paraburkholderia TaxID=2615204 RepID=UPI0032FB556F|nr:hypothetical protein [Burkholderia vietnamiensis]